MDLFDLFRVDFHDGRLANGAFRVKVFKLSRGSREMDQRQ